MKPRNADQTNPQVRQGPFVKMWRDFRAIPAASLQRRALYVALLAAGVVMTGFGSIFLARTGPIPWGLIPDLRFFALATSGVVLGLYASGGGAHRRALALWGVVGYVVAFHLEEATVHWIGPIPGSITGTPVGLLGTSGSLLALLAVVLMHIEVESTKLARDLTERGADAADARVVGGQLARQGVQRVIVVALGVAGLGALVLGLVPAFGFEVRGGEWVLPLGGALLIGLAVAVSRIAPRRAA